MTHTAINRFRQLAYGQKQAAEADLAPTGYDKIDKAVADAGAAQTEGFKAGLAARTPVIAAYGGVAGGGLSAILAALLSKKENMLRNAAIAGGAGAAAGATGAVAGARVQAGRRLEEFLNAPHPAANNLRRLKDPIPTVQDQRDPIPTVQDQRDPIPTVQDQRGPNLTAREYLLRQQMDELRKKQRKW